MRRGLRLQVKAASQRQKSFVDLRLLWVTVLGFLGLILFSALVIAQATPGTNISEPLVWYPMIANKTNSLVDGSGNHFNGAFSANYDAAYGPGPSTNVGLYIAPGYGTTTFLSPTNSYSSLTFATWFKYVPVNGVPVGTTQIASGTDSATNSWSLYVDGKGVAHVALRDVAGRGKRFLQWIQIHYMMVIGTSLHP